MLAVLLAATSAIIWGTADFSGGKATRYANSLVVTVVAELSALPLLALALVLYPVPTPAAADLGWGALAGLVGFVGLVLFYRGLATGAMSVVAPVAAVISALVPFAVGLALDGTPGNAALIGAGLAVVATGLVSVGHGGHRVTGTILTLALASGGLFGLFFVLLQRASPESGAWPLLAMRLAALVVGVPLLIRRRRQGLRLSRAALRWAVVAGVLDLVANGFYLVAVHLGQLSVVAPVNSLYPASTVLLALAVDGERVRPIQVLGLGLAVAALVLTAT